MDKGFPVKFSNWIMTCVTTVLYSLLLNGGLTSPFTTKREIGQGDSMSLYLFVLDMEYLGRELGQLADTGDFNFHPRCRKLGSIYIYFADDLRIFCRADYVSVRLMEEAF